MLRHRKARRSHKLLEPKESPAALVVLFMRAPTKEIEDAASAMKPGDSDSVRAVVESMFKVPGMYRMPDMMAAVVKQRIIDAQTAYLGGKTTGVTDGAVVDAINMLATTFQTPEYGMVSLLRGSIRARETRIYDAHAI